jgi:glycosyltransferase involved in cell wall biosynthesis
LKDLGIELAVAAPAGGDLAALASDMTIPYFEVPLGGRLKVSTVKDLRTIINDWPSDVIHAHGSRAASFARLADARASRRLIYTIHGIHSDKGLLSLPKLLLERHLAARTAHFIAVCKSDALKATRLKVARPDKIETIYNGIEAYMPYSETIFLEKREQARTELCDQLQIDPSSNIFLHIGRISKQKGQLDLLDALARHRKNPAGSNAKLLALTAGSKESLNNLQLEATKRGLEDCMYWLELRPDPLPLYLAADAFVLSSLWEGFPYTVLEAANAGCPVIATAVDVIPEAIASPQEGLLVPPSDPQALASALDDFCALGKSERILMAQQAKARTNKEFRLDKMLAETVAAYEKLKYT